ncbi:MAG: BON domain-containing protein [Gammaproteobacteria bacterium]
MDISRLLLMLLIMLLSMTGCTALVVSDVAQGGYTVSSADAGIVRKIHQSFSADRALRNADITANSVDGRVTLHGRVSSRTIEQRAVKLANTVQGVRQAVSRLTVSSH